MPRGDVACVPAFLPPLSLQDGTQAVRQRVDSSFGSGLYNTHSSCNATALNELAVFNFPLYCLSHNLVFQIEFRHAFAQRGNFWRKNDDIYMWNIWDLSWSSTCEESGKQISPLWLCLRHHLKSVCFHMKSCVNSCGSIWLSEPVCICHVHQADGEGLEEGDSRRVCLTLKPEAKESSLFGNTLILATLWWLRVCVLPGGNLATSPQRCLEE